MNIHDYEHKRYSQFGEDGVTLELVRRLDPPMTFLEIGCGDGTENNTLVLLERGWTGRWIDADLGNAQKAAQVNAQTNCARVTIETRFPPEPLGVLSIDVDGNDYWLWKALCGGTFDHPPLRPSIVIIEAQIQKPHDVEYVMSYDPDYVWDNVSQDCGASVASLEKLGRQLGYTSLGLLSNEHAPNLFFVRDDLVEKLGD